MYQPLFFLLLSFGSITETFHLQAADKIAEKSAIVSESRHEVDYTTPEGRARELTYQLEEQSKVDNSSPKLNAAALEKKIEVRAKNTRGTFNALLKASDGGTSKISTEVNSHGMLTISIETKQRPIFDGEVKKGPVSGQDLLRTAMEFHKKAHHHVESVLGVWVGGDNLFALNTYLHKHFQLKPGANLQSTLGALSNDERTQLYLKAARTTWTGKQLETYGYDPIEIQEIHFEKGETISSFVVLFTKKSHDSAEVQATQ